MKKFNYTVTDELGIHARPAGILVKEVKQYKSTITLSCGEKSSDATRLLAVMGMGVKKGNEVTVTIEGEDEAAALTGMERFFKDNL